MFELKDSGSPQVSHIVPVASKVDVVNSYPVVRMRDRLDAHLVLDLNVLIFSARQVDKNDVGKLIQPVHSLNTKPSANQTTQLKGEFKCHKLTFKL